MLVEGTGGEAAELAAKMKKDLGVFKEETEKKRNARELNFTMLAEDFLGKVEKHFGFRRFRQ